MPALKEPPAEIASGSFADAAGAEHEENEELNTGTDDAAAKAAEEAAAKAAEEEAAKGADASTLENPHLKDEPAAAKVDTVVDADEIPAENLKGMTPAAQAKARETWSMIKKSEKAAIAERDAFKAQVADFNKRMDEAGKSGPEVERLKKELADRETKLKEFESEISVTRIEATPQYKKEVAGPIQSAEDYVRALAKKHELSSAAALLDALRETDPEKRQTDLEELSSDFGFADRKNLFDAAKEHSTASALGESMRKDAGTKLEQMTREQQADMERAATANVEDYRAATQDTWKTIQAAHPLLNHVEGQQKWNDHLDGIKREIESVDVNNLPLAEVAKYVTAHHVLPEITAALAHYQKSFKSERDARLAAEKKLQEYRATAPGAGAGRTAEERGAKGEGAGSFLDAVAGGE